MLGIGVLVESCFFKGFKLQEFINLRKVIEIGDVVIVESLVWDNLRFLVSSGDIFVILQVIMYVEYGRV